MRLFLALVFLMSCTGETPNPARPEGRPRIVATTGFIGSLVDDLAGSWADVQVMMGPGVDPHLYKPTAGDIDRLSQADLIVYNGLHLESKLGEVFASLGARRPVLALAESLPRELLLTEGGAVDPHVWHDASLWAQTVPALEAALTAIAPERASEVAEASRSLQKALLELHEDIAAGVAALPPERRVLVTAHDAFSYFGRAYGLEVLGLQGLSTVDEAGTRDVQLLADTLASRKIPALFVESSVSPKAMEALGEAVRARGHEIRLGGELFSDALGAAGTPEGTYAGMLRHNLATLVAGLGSPE